MAREEEIEEEWWRWWISEMENDPAVFDLGDVEEDEEEEGGGTGQ